METAQNQRGRAPEQRAHAVQPAAVVQPGPGRAAFRQPGRPVQVAATTTPAVQRAAPAAQVQGLQTGQQDRHGAARRRPENVLPQPVGSHDHDGAAVFHVDGRGHRDGPGGRCRVVQPHATAPVAPGRGLRARGRRRRRPGDQEPQPEPGGSPAVRGQPAAVRVGPAGVQPAVVRKRNEVCGRLHGHLLGRGRGGGGGCGQQLSAGVVGQTRLVLGAQPQLGRRRRPTAHRRQHVAGQLPGGQTGVRRADEPDRHGGHGRGRRGRRDGGQRQRGAVVVAQVASAAAAAAAVQRRSLADRRWRRRQRQTVSAAAGMRRRRAKGTRDAQDAVPELSAQRRTGGVQPETVGRLRVPVRQGRAAQVAVGGHGQAVQLHGRLCAGQVRAPATAVPAAVAPAQADRVAQTRGRRVGRGVRTVRRDGRRLGRGQQTAAPRAPAALASVQQQNRTTVVAPTRRRRRRR